MIRRLTFVAAVTVAIILIAAPLGQVILSGTYLDKLGRPIAGALTEWLDDSGSTVARDTTSSTGDFTLSMTTSGIGGANQTLGGFSLGQNYPNPFNPSTRLSVSVEQVGTFTIYDILGREVAHQSLPIAGTYQVNWGGGDSQGRGVAAGVYIYVLRSGRRSTARKMTLLDGGNGGPLTISRTSLIGSAGALGKAVAGESIRFSKGNTTTLTMPIGAINADTSLGSIVGNIGPTALASLADTVLAVGDTMILYVVKAFRVD